MAESSNVPKIFSEHAKAIMTLRNGKTLEQPSQGSLTNSESSKKRKDEDLKIGDESIMQTPPCLPKALFPSALKAPIPMDKKEGKLDEMLELFKQVQINLPLLDAIK